MARNKTSRAYNPNPNLPMLIPLFASVCSRCKHQWGPHPTNPKPCRHQIEDLKREREGG